VFGLNDGSADVDLLFVLVLGDSECFCDDLSRFTVRVKFTLTVILVLLVEYLVVSFELFEEEILALGVDLFDEIGEVGGFPAAGGVIAVDLGGVE